MLLAIYKALYQLGPKIVYQVLLSVKLLAQRRLVDFVTNSIN